MTTQEQTAPHTPGPWRIDPDDDSTWRILGPGERGQWNNEIGELAYTGGNAEANARLIASAPALLAALERVADMPCEFSMGPCPICQARAAIAAAKEAETQEAGL